VLVVAMAGAVGFVVPAAVGAMTASASAWLVVPALLAAGAVEGSVLGLGQAIVLRRAVPGISTPRWVLATAVGSVLAWAFGLLPSSLLYDVWAAMPSVAVAGAGAVIGALVLISVGTAQSLVLRRHVDAAHRWIAITALAWLVGLLLLIEVTFPLWTGAEAVWPTFAIVVAGGVAMAVATACVTGVGLARMLASSDRSS
jgi:hypothetical protein